MKSWVYDLGEPTQSREMETENPIRADRSRYVELLTCEQKRWMNYHAGPAGLGFSGSASWDDLALGTAVHLGMEVAMQAWHRSIHQEEEIDSREMAIAAYDVAAYSFRESAGTGLVMAGDPAMKIINPELYEELTEEQAALAGLLAGAGVAVWLPQIMEDYYLVSTEQEIDWTVDGRVVVMSRPDAVLMRKSDGQLFVVSYKTTKTFYPSDLEKLAFDIQALTEMAAASARGLEPSGVLYAYFIKGSRKKIVDGELSYSRYSSGLLRPWVDGRQLQPNLRSRWESLPDPVTGRKNRLGPNFDQLSFTEQFGLAHFGRYGLSHRDYFIQLLDGEFDEENGGPALESLIAAPEPILRPRGQMDRIATQILEDELRWQQTQEGLVGDDFYKEAQMNPGACQSFGRTCQWSGACWGEGSSEVQRLIRIGRVGVRVPNHSQEVEDE